jgi:hypothetical protein
LASPELLATRAEDLGLPLELLTERQREVLFLHYYADLDYTTIAGTGTSAETGQSVRIPGFEEWTIAEDGLIAESLGRFDQDEYDRQLRDGAGG